MLRALKREESAHTGEMLDALKNLHDLIAQGLLVPKDNLNQYGQATVEGTLDQALGVLRRSRKYGYLYATDQNR